MGWLFRGVFKYKSVCTIIKSFFFFFLNGFSASAIAPSASITPLHTYIHIQWGMLQRTNATINGFYQQNQDATTNTDVTKKAEAYYQPM